jgi:hypothetical protein
MREDDGGDYAARIMDLERALLAFVVRIHRTSDCGVGGAHEPECDALFEQLGWENYEEYVVAMADELEQDGQQVK